MRRFKLSLFFLLSFLILSGCKEKIIHEISEFEANKIVAHLNDLGITASKKIEASGSWSIEVEKEDSLRSIKLINSSRIIRNTSSKSEDSSSLVTSREEQRFKFERGLSREIESTLLNIPSVLEARVHLNQPLVDPILGKPIDGQKGSGSVLLLVDAGREVPRKQIAELVAGASGINAESISVVVAEEPRDIVNNKIDFFKDLPAITPLQITSIDVAPNDNPSSLQIFNKNAGELVKNPISIAVVGLITFLLLTIFISKKWFGRKSIRL